MEEDHDLPAIAAPEEPAMLEPPQSIGGISPERAETIVRQWVAMHIADSPVSRAVEAINHLNSKIDALVEAIVKG